MNDLSPALLVTRSGVYCHGLTIRNDKRIYPTIPGSASSGTVPRAHPNLLWPSCCATNRPIRTNPECSAAVAATAKMAPSDDLKAHAASSHDFYALLEVSPAASESEIRRGYRRAALKYHPDKIANPTPAD
ncbi:hypothetical protein T310_8094, partial [Rasamsonia emersonii CBS 393.64]